MIKKFQVFWCFVEKFNMERILFFGASGKLGKNWLSDLLRNKNKVTVNINQNIFKKKEI